MEGGWKFGCRPLSLRMLSSKPIKEHFETLSKGSFTGKVGFESLPRRHLGNVDSAQIQKKTRVIKTF
jgi:hypothetical protein